MHMSRLQSKASNEVETRKGADALDRRRQLAAALKVAKKHSNPTYPLASNVTLVPESSYDEDENGFAAKAAFGMLKSGMTDHH